MTYEVGKKGQIVFVREQGPWDIKYRPVVLKKYKHCFFKKHSVRAVVEKNGKAFEVWVSDLFDAPENFVQQRASA